MTIYIPIAPTYLCIKQHSITKKKYFCKTTKPDPIKYLGSGKYWLRHIKKHGKQFVETIWLSDLYYDTSIVEHALQFSTENNIVESDNWANFIPENGLDGGAVGREISAETRAKLSAALKGKKKSHEHITNASTARIGTTHSKESKAKMSASHKGILLSEETKARMSAAKSGVNRAPHSKKSKDKISAAKKGVPQPLFFSLISTKKTYGKANLSVHYPEFKKFY